MIQYKIGFQDLGLSQKGPPEGKILVFNNKCHKK